MANQDEDREYSSVTRRSLFPVPSYLLAMLYLDGAWRDVAGSPGGHLRPPDVGMLGVVHDLCGPLTALLSSTTLLAEILEALPPEKRSVVHLLQRSGLLLQGRLENLLCAAAIWDGSFKIHPQPLDLRDIAQEVHSALVPVIRERGQRLESIIQGEGHRVHADPRRLAQVLVNLILNASEHGSERSSIKVHLQTTESSVRVSVGDRGPGIPQERLPGLFELFDQPVDAVATGRITLGLAIVRAIAEAHNGLVSARNRRGGGACVWFELPRIVGADRIVAVPGILT